VTHLTFDVFVTVCLCQYNRYFKLLLIDDEISCYFKLLHFFSCPIDIHIAPTEIWGYTRSGLRMYINVIDCIWNVMAHVRKPDFVFLRNGRVHLNRRGASVQSATGSRGVRISGSNAGYTMFRGSVKGTGYPLRSPVSPSLLLPCVTVCHHISSGLYIVSTFTFYHVLRHCIAFLAHFSFNIRSSIFSYYVYIIRFNLCV